MGNNNCSTIIRGTLNISSLQLNGQFGTNGQVITTNGNGVPYWVLNNNNTIDMNNSNIYNATELDTTYVDSSITNGPLYIGTQNTSNIYLGNTNSLLTFNSSNIILTEPLTLNNTGSIPFSSVNIIGHITNLIDNQSYTFPRASARTWQIPSFAGISLGTGVWFVVGTFRLKGAVGQVIAVSFKDNTNFPNEKLVASTISLPTFNNSDQQIIQCKGIFNAQYYGAIYAGFYSSNSTTNLTVFTNCNLVALRIG
jgi:phage tail sheath protein FI